MILVVERSFCTRLEDSRKVLSTLVVKISDWRYGSPEGKASFVAGLSLLLDDASFAKTLSLGTQCGTSVSSSSFLIFIEVIP